MTPWLVLSLLTAGINLSLFLLVRGRLDRLVPPLALAGIIGAMAGNALADVTGIEAVRIGDFNLISASILSQLAMLVTSLLSILGTPRRAE